MSVLSQWVSLTCVHMASSCLCFILAKNSRWGILIIAVLSLIHVRCLSLTHSLSLSLADWLYTHWSRTKIIVRGWQDQRKGWQLCNENVVPCLLTSGVFPSKVYSSVSIESTHIWSHNIAAVKQKLFNGKKRKRNHYQQECVVFLISGLVNFLFCDGLFRNFTFQTKNSWIEISVRTKWFVHV